MDYYSSRFFFNNKYKYSHKSVILLDNTYNGSKHWLNLVYILSKQMNNSTKNPEIAISKYSGMLNNPANSDIIRKMTSDTLFLLSKEGICVDVDLHTDRWFLQNTSKYIGKNIFEILPSETAMAIRNNFEKVISTGVTATDNYEIQLSGKTYYFKCIIYDYNEELVLCQYRDITQRILLRQRLEITNRKLQEIEKVAQIGQWIYNTKSKEFQYSGFSGGLANNGEIKHISLKDYLKFVHPGDKTKLENFIDQNLRVFTDSYIAYRIILNDTIFYFRLKAINSYMEDGIPFINGYVQNITDIMLKQHELEMVTLAVENSSDYIFAMKTDGQLVFGNRKFKEYNGWNADMDITQTSLFDILKSGSGKSRWLDIIHQLSCTNQTINFVLPKPIPNKPEILAFDCISYLVQDSKGVDMIWTFGKDITERVHYEKQVKELNQIMSTVLKNIPMSISVKDVENDFKYIFSNREADDFHWGIKDEMIGKTDFDMFPRKLAEIIRQEDEVSVTSKHENRKIIEVKDENGEKQVRDQLRILVKDDTRPLLISIERDITKDKQLEQELIDAKEKAEQSDKLKSAFIANMSHEIRTPLNAIVGFSRIIAETQDMEERQSYYSIVETNNIRLLGLINEILDLSKIESGVMAFENEPMKLSLLCNDLAQSLSIKCSGDVKLIFDESDPELIIKGDKNRLTQVFENLVGNSSKFTEKGSINFGYKLKEKKLELYVKDTGAGIPPDKIEKIFDRFVKADNFTQGTGLGLPICKSIIEKMGGQISVTSTLGIGTCFTFSLPTSCIITNSISKEEETKTVSDTKNYMEKTILVAEDTDSNYVLLDAMIGKLYALKRANNGLEAVSMFESLKPDLILMDIKMPVMSGLDATKIIRKTSSDVIIIAQSAFAFDEDRKLSMECGCNDFLTKPFNKKQVIEIINKYLN